MNFDGVSYVFDSAIDLVINGPEEMIRLIGELKSNVQQKLSDNDFLKRINSLADIIDPDPKYMSCLKYRLRPDIYINEALPIIMAENFKNLRKTIEEDSKVPFY